MKRFLTYLAVFILSHTVSLAQVSINTSGELPDSSAMVDIKSTTKGLLVPRMTETQRMGIASAKTGLLVFQTDRIAGFYYYSGTAWTQVNDPCGQYIVAYEFSNYHTIKIGSQCWLRENLNAGTKISSSINQSNNLLIEKYCYLESDANCYLYGGLYQWNEAMQYSSTEGAQGICPDGWHIPTDNDWKILEGYMDSRYGIGSAIWDNQNFRGFNAGRNLKSIEDYWANPLSNADFMGFKVIPGGTYDYGITQFFGVGNYAWFWTSTSNGPAAAWYRNLSSSENGVNRFNTSRNYGYAVRCIRD